MRRRVLLQHELALAAQRLVDAGQDTIRGACAGGDVVQEPHDVGVAREAPEADRRQVHRVHLAQATEARVRIVAERGIERVAASPGIVGVGTEGGALCRHPAESVRARISSRNPASCASLCPRRALRAAGANARASGRVACPGRPGCRPPTDIASLPRRATTRDCGRRLPTSSRARRADSGGSSTRWPATRHEG